MSNNTSLHQIPLNSDIDIIMEIILILNCNFNAYSKYNKNDVCGICFCEALDQYVLEFPCSNKHIFHRNCLLMNIINYKRFNCPLCHESPK